MDVKDKVYISLQECLNESEKIPTSQIADNLHLSRQIVTHYLNQLFHEVKVKKTYTPVTEKNGVKLEGMEAEDAAKEVVKLIYDAKIL